jgi:hypothetical protein
LSLLLVIVLTALLSCTTIPNLATRLVLTAVLCVCFALLYSQYLLRASSPSTTIMASTAAKIIVVTGSNKGIGFEIVKGLQRAIGHELANDSRIVLCARKEELGKAAIDKIRSEVGANDTADVGIDLGLVDIAKPDSVEWFYDDIRTRYGHVDILINNAGFAFKVPHQCHPY